MSMVRTWLQHMPRLIRLMHASTYHQDVQIHTIPILPPYTSKHKIQVNNTDTISSFFNVVFAFVQITLETLGIKGLDMLCINKTCCSRGCAWLVYWLFIKEL